MDLLQIKNPFTDIKNDHTETLPAGDVPELHAEIFNKYLQAIQQASAKGHSIGVMSVGEAGSGKSLLIARLRSKLSQHVGKDSNASVITIRLRQGRLGNIWQPIRKELFTELLRPQDKPADKINELMRIVAKCFPEWANNSQSESNICNAIFGKKKLKDYLSESKFSDLDRELKIVLSHLDDPQRADIALAWLRGNQLSHDDLNKLNLSTESLSPVERENRASEVVLSFLKLVGNSSLLVLCFDEVEAIQSGNWDTAVLRELATAIVTILGIKGPRVVITTVRLNVFEDLRKATDMASFQKICTTPHPIFFRPLTWEQMLRLVHARINAEPTCRERRGNLPPESDWPLTRPFLERFYRENQLVLTPRHVLMACAEEFERTIEAPPPNDPPNLQNLLAESWNEKVKEVTKKTKCVDFNHVFGITLPWLARLLNLPCRLSEAKFESKKDVDMIFSWEDRSLTGITLCSDSPHLLWRRLDRLSKQWQENKYPKLTHLHLLRAEEQHTTPKSLERIEKLAQAQVQIHLLSKQVIAETAGYYHLLQEVQKGDLTWKNGKQITQKEYNDWAIDQVRETQSVKELLNLIFGNLKVARVMAGV